MLGRQILSNEGCLNSWTVCHRSRCSLSLSIFTQRWDILWQGNHSWARSFQAGSRRHWVGVTDLRYAGGQPKRANGLFWLQSQRKYDLIKHRKPTQAKAQVWQTAKSLLLGCKWSAQAFTCTTGNQRSWSQDCRITQMLRIIRICAVSNQWKQIGWIWGRLCTQGKQNIGTGLSDHSGPQGDRHGEEVGIIFRVSLCLVLWSLSLHSCKTQEYEWEILRSGEEEGQRRRKDFILPGQLSPWQLFN